MKVLIVTGCVYAQNCNRTSFTGLDYVVGEIAEKVGEKCEVTVYTMTPYPESSRIRNAKIISYNPLKLIKYLSIKDFKNYISITLRFSDSVKSKIKNLRAYLVAKDIENYCQRKKIDIVHIQGATFASCIVAAAVAKCNIPILFTLHGLISFGTPGITKLDKMSERALIKVLKKECCVFTTVSQGVKDIICNFQKMKKEKIIVVNNAVNFPDVDSHYNFLKHYNIGSRKIIISVGSVSENKNQMQLIRAYEMLPKLYRERFVVFLVGKDESLGIVPAYIKEHNLEDSVFLCGFLKKEELREIYEAAEFNVMLSRSEGFGLSMIEASYFGIPTLTFKDLDAVKDIYRSDSMLLMDNRKDATVVSGLIEMINSNWSSECIKKSAERFNTEIYLEYTRLYDDILKTSGNYMSSNIILEEIGLR